MQISGSGNNLKGRSIAVNHYGQTPIDSQGVGEAPAEKTPDGAADDSSKGRCRKVFVIHGHNEARWRELVSLLEGMNINAIELSQQTLNGKTIIEKFEYFASQCSFAFAIFTYDDIVHKDGKEYLQVRPNVIFELGWFYARLGRERVMIIEEKNDNGHVFSDLEGIYRYSFYAKVSELYKDILDVLEISQ